MAITGLGLAQAKDDPNGPSRQAEAVPGGFYEKGAVAALAQEMAGPMDPLMLPGPEEYKASTATGDVTGMTQKVIDDAKAIEAEFIRAEKDRAVEACFEVCWLCEEYDE